MPMSPSTPEVNRPRWLTTALLCLSLSIPIGTDSWAQGTHQERRLSIATGAEGGRYKAYAHDLARALERHSASVRLSVLPTAGSYDNARMLRNGEVDLAIMQGDVAFLEQYQRRSFVAVGVLFPEIIHVLARRELGFEDIAELTSYAGTLRISVGPLGSGTAAHGAAVLSALGMDDGSALNLSNSEALDRLEDRSIDVVFITSGVGIVRVTEMMADRTASLVRFDRQVSSRIRKENPLLSLIEIPVGAYPSMLRSVPSLGVWTVMASSRGFAPELVDEVIRADAAVEEGLEAESPAERLRHSTIPVHPRAHQRTRSGESRLARWLREAGRRTWPLAGMALGFVFLWRLPRLAYALYQYLLGRMFVVVATVWAVGSLVMYWVESGKNSAFRTFGHASVATLHYLFSGLEAKYPVTTIGNVTAIIILGLGVGAVGLFTAEIVSWLVERALNLQHLKIKPQFFFAMRRHVIVAGWSPRTERVLRQLRSRDLSWRPSVAVIAEKALEARVKNRNRFRGVFVVEGQPWEEATLKQADLANAKVALVLTPTSTEPNERLRNVATTLAIESLNPKVRTVVEADSADLEAHLKITDADDIVQTGALQKRMLSQAVLTPGITKVYDELLSFHRKSQEIYVGEIPKRFQGLTFRQIQSILLETPVSPIGVHFLEKVEVRGAMRRFVLNPSAIRELATRRLSGEDELVYLADNANMLKNARVSADKALAPRAEREEETVSARKEQAIETVHIGICGWSPAALAIIEQLHSKLIAKRTRYIVTVVTPRGLTEDENRTVSERKLRDVSFVVKDVTKKEDLLGAGIADFQTLVILADRYEAQDRPKYLDHHSLLIALSASDAKKGLHQVVEVVDSSNIEHFARVPNCEIVSVEDLAERVLAQTVVTPGITKVILRLLTATADSNEVYAVPVGSVWAGRSFEDLLKSAVDERAGFIPIGIESLSEEGQVNLTLNPQVRKSAAAHKRDYRLKSDDRVILLAYEQPVLDEFVVTDGAMHGEKEAL